MYHNQDYTWVDDLEHVTKTYNETKHSTIKMTPTQALSADTSILWRRQFLPSEKRTSLPKHKRKDRRRSTSELYKFKVGDTVRIGKLKKTFSRAYDENWTHELFIIVDRESQQGIPKYTLKDWDNELIDGKFYEEEIKKVSVNDNTEFKIEKLIKRKTQSKQKGYIVRWLGWPKKYDSWVSEKEVKDFKKIK